MHTPTDRRPTVTLKPREERRLRAGHLWVFSNEIDGTSGNPGQGDVVRVQSHNKSFLGTGIYNPHSLIAVRLIDRGDKEPDREWFRCRIAAALELRQTLYPHSNTYRLVHSESDGIPGIIIDRFEDVAVVQIASVGMEQRRELLYDVLMELDGIKGIVERNDHSLRSLEGLPNHVGVARGTADPQIVSDGFIRYYVDPLGGQKTGFYLDQRENRIAMRRFMDRGRVLDLFSNNGGFALHARQAGAAEVIAVDTSAAALREVERNRQLNDLEEIELRTTDVFIELEERLVRKETFDVVIADPPPFARARRHVTAARKKYVELFTKSICLLKPNGVAFLASCSHHITRETFMEVLREALRKAHRNGIILEECAAAPDHPIHPSMPETGYLHAVILAMRER